MGFLGPNGNQMKMRGNPHFPFICEKSYGECVCVCSWCDEEGESKSRRNQLRVVEIKDLISGIILLLVYFFD